VKILFIGGGEWGTAVLKSALEPGHEISVVDSPRLNNQGTLKGGFLLRKILHASRLAQIIYSLIKKNNSFYRTIWSYRLPIFLTDSINKKSFIDKVRASQFDLILVASCAEILKKDIIELPRFGCVNCHPSLLPKYRGPNPFFWVLLNREKETGVTFHYINEDIDGGDIILQHKIQITPQDNEESLISKCASLAHSMTQEVLEIIKDDTARRYPQQEKLATYYPNLTLTSKDKFHIKELTEPEGKTWDELITRSPQYNIFSSFFWLKTISDATRGGYKIIVCYQKNRPLCGLAAMMKASLEGRLFTSTPLSQYSSILLFPAQDPLESQGNHFKYRQVKSLVALSEYLKSNFDWSVLYLHPSFTTMLPGQLGWQTDDRYTYYLDLRDADRLYSNFASILKRQIKKGENDNFSIEGGLRQPESFYNLWKKTMLWQKARLPLNSREFAHIYRELNRARLIRTFCAYSQKGELAAAVIFLIEQKLAYYWASTLNRKYASSGINQLLLWKGLRQLSKWGIERLDFVGADIPSIANYKKQFGGDLVFHRRARLVSSPRARIVREAKRIYKSVFSKNG
jgi:methionyl-tRNA formyltransferase